MKKFIILAVMILFLCGCTNINKSSINKITNDALNSKHSYANMVRVGYKYYKPLQMSVIESSDYNETLRSDGVLYYLYIDTVSYYNKTNNLYTENDISYYSKTIKHKDKSGFIEINELEDNQYLIEIMYNYAKIEVMVDKRRINEAIAFSLSILSSIKYNDVVINNKLGQDVFNTHEESFNLFKSEVKDNATLKYVEDSRYDKDVIPDMDLIN